LVAHPLMHCRGRVGADCVLERLELDCPVRLDHAKALRLRERIEDELLKRHSVWLGGLDEMARVLDAGGLSEPTLERQPIPTRQPLDERAFEDMDGDVACP